VLIIILPGRRVRTGRKTKPAAWLLRNVYLHPLGIWPQITSGYETTAAQMLLFPAAGTVLAGLAVLGVALAVGDLAPARSAIALLWLIPAAAIGTFGLLMVLLMQKLLCTLVLWRRCRQAAYDANLLVEYASAWLPAVVPLLVAGLYVLMEVWAHRRPEAGAAETGLRFGEGALRVCG
jgi:hypothetical protein